MSKESINPYSKVKVMRIQPNAEHNRYLDFVEIPPASPGRIWPTTLTVDVRYKGEGGAESAIILDHVIIPAITNRINGPKEKTPLETDTHASLNGRAIVHSNKRYDTKTDKLSDVLHDLMQYAARDYPPGHFNKALDEALTRFNQ
jgi:hypothetical protein